MIGNLVHVLSCHVDIELRMCMALMGTPTLGDIHRNMVDTRSLHVHSSDVPRDNLYQTNYTPLPLPLQRSRL
jgi:hypothetical protein